MANGKWQMDRLPPSFRLMVSSIGILTCFFIIWVTAQAGFSRLLAKYAILNSSIDAADKIVALAPSDPESHRVRAAVLYRFKRAPDAARELERAVSLRPRDDYLWLELAMIRDELQDSAGALTAFNESVRLAPYYAYPRWQRGNFLLRQRRFDEAFADLHQAAASNADFIPNLIDLAWGISRGDVAATVELAQVTSNQRRAAFAGFLARKGKAKEAAAQFALVGDASDETRRQLVRELISSKSFAEAFEIWKHNEGNGSRSATIHDGGFEGPLGFEEFGFGWRISRSPQGVKLAADSSQRHSGSKSLLVEFQGDSNPDSSLVSQLILVEPSRRYRINFAARTRSIVSGGLPVAIVSDASGDPKRLGESAPLRPDLIEWQVLSFDFQTESTTKAVVLSIQRQSCSTPPCPIFGFVWLDSFSIEAR
jgi:hypothetical protein